LNNLLMFQLTAKDDYSDHFHKRVPCDKIETRDFAPL